MKTGNEISLDDVQCTGINSDGSCKMSYFLDKSQSVICIETADYAADTG
jgi:hypothetical protein